jgi:uncharacterized protein (DUF433 family)
VHLQPVSETGRLHAADREGLTPVREREVGGARFGFAGSGRNCDNGQETAVKNFDRITVDPAQMGGVPCVRRLRIPVATVLRLLAGGLTEGEILAEYPDLESEDIRECLRFAAAWAMERELPLPHSA